VAARVTAAAAGAVAARPAPVRPAAASVPGAAVVVVGKAVEEGVPAVNNLAVQPNASR
jgi:hypothetical protein